MKYCLGVALHNLYFDIAILDSDHNLIDKKRFIYDRSKDLSHNIYTFYRKEFSNYRIDGVAVAISNNINFKEDIIFKITAFNLDRYDLKKSLIKQFKTNVTIIEETYAASLGAYNSMECNSLMYVIVDNKISNSFVIDDDILLLEEDIDLFKNEQLNSRCCKDELKKSFLAKNFDDECIGTYCISQDDNVQKIIKLWASELNKELEKVVKHIKVEKIVFAGYMGGYFQYYKEYMNITHKFDCCSVSNHTVLTLLGLSHLIFKDKC